MIRLSDLFDERLVALDLVAANKNEVFQKLVCLLASCDRIEGAANDALCEKLDDREKIGSTAIGEGIAIPHAYFANIMDPILVFARLSDPVDFDSDEGENVRLVFLLVGPKRNDTEHLMILARLSRLLKDEQFRAVLDTVDSGAALIEAIRQGESRH